MLEKSVKTVYGDSAIYWSITTINVDVPTMTAVVILGGWTSQVYFAEGRPPITFQEFRFTPDNLPGANELWGLALGVLEQGIQADIAWNPPPVEEVVPVEPIIETVIEPPVETTETME